MKEKYFDDTKGNMTSDDFLLIEEYDTVNIVDSVSNWVINIGTLVHDTFKRNILCSYTPSESGNVKLAHEGVVKCVGFRDV